MAKLKEFEGMTMKHLGSNKTNGLSLEPAR